MSHRLYNYNSKNQFFLTKTLQLSTNENKISKNYWYPKFITLVNLKICITVIQRVSQKDSNCTKYNKQICLYHNVIKQISNYYFFILMCLKFATMITNKDSYFEPGLLVAFLLFFNIHSV